MISLRGISVKALLQKGLALRDSRDAGTISLQTAVAKAGCLTDRLVALCTRITHAGNERLASFAEQAIRPAVVNRKVWGSSRTQRGAQAQGILMSVLRTALNNYDSDYLERS